MGEETRPNPSRATIARWVAFGLIITAIGIAIGIAIDWFPVQGSTQAKKIDTLWDVLIIASVPFFVLVAGVVLFSVSHFRQRPGEELLDGPSIHGSTRLEVVWTTVPALLILGLVAYAGFVLHDIEKTPANAAQELKVDVYGQQFAWTFRYKAPNGKTVNTTRLYLPVNKSVNFNVHAKDVIHDFWIPAMRMKIDAVPGITTHYRITPIRNGTYPVVCAELCGLGHAFMRSTVYVVPQARFNSWLTKQTAPPPAAADGSAAPVDAKTLFDKGNGNSIACASCHQLSDASSPQGIGPNLDKALKGKDDAFIKESIVHPNAEIAKGFPAGVMPPNFEQTLKPAELDALVKYLAKVTK
jgi:cytochrome c oxidase subunit 2